MMRRLWGVFFSCLLAAVFFSAAFAQEDSGAAAGSQMPQGGMMMQKGKMMGSKLKKMHSMMPKSSLVATADGGIVVMIGNKLQKYNKDLVLQNEIKIEIDMQEMMMPMRDKCPVMDKPVAEEEQESREEE